MKATVRISTSRVQVLKIVLVAIFVWIVWGVSFGQFFDPWILTPDARFAKKWCRDFKNLSDSHHLPAGFDKIKDIEFTVTNDHLREIIASEKIPGFKKLAQENRANSLVSQKGFILQVFLDQMEDGGIMIQYDLIDDNGNTIWELGRSLFPDKF